MLYVLANHHRDWLGSLRLTQGKKTLGNIVDQIVNVDLTLIYL